MTGSVLSGKAGAAVCRNRMNKEARQELIRKIIESQSIGTQVELTRAVRKEGVEVTQATICRDIKEMQLVKTLSKSGKYQYAIIPEEEGFNIQGRFIRMLKDGIIGIGHANNQVVIRTLAGSAHVVAEVLDNFEWKEVLGTIAGDNTILVIARSNEAVKVFLRRIEAMTGIAEETDEADPE